MNFHRESSFILWLSCLIFILPFSIFPVSLSAQTLEEIVVTAQRREQSLQEVPVSLEAYTGEVLLNAGFRGLHDLESFSPSVEIRDQVRQSSVTIRGIGSHGGNLSIDPAAPIFVDGIHFGRQTMSKGAFLDVERLEVLRGPQPVYFGQNATAGAFSIVTKKPTPEWEGNVTAEVGNFGRRTIEGALGGPVSNTFGIRVAAQWDETTGHILDVLEDKKFPYRMDAGGRITLQWRPVENFSALFKAEYMKRNSDGDPNAICLTPEGSFFEGRDQKIETAVLVQGEVPEWDALHINKYTLPNCRNGWEGIGLSDASGNYLRPIPGIRSDNNRSGIVDFFDIAEEKARASGILDPDCVLCAADDMDAYNYRLALNYRFENGIELEAVTGMVDYKRVIYEDPQPSPFLSEVDFRIEGFDMWSQELRLRSPIGGTIEWEAGAYWQDEQLDLDPSDNYRANIRRPVRANASWGDNRWISVFATLTFNFLDNRASIDLGGRYTDVHKEGWMQSLGSTLIFDIDPDPDGDGEVLDAAGTRTLDMGDEILDCATGVPQCGDFGAGFWTHDWRVNYVPAVWNGDVARPVAFGPEITGLLRADLDENGIFTDTHDEDSFDPQITLRYRPNDNISLYAKWAKAFKAGGFDTGHKSPPDDIDAFSFEAEHAENFEIGAKGTLLGGRARYDATLFWMTMDNLQGETSGVFVGADGSLITEGSVASNAGKARNRGLEFGLVWAASDRLRVGVQGALMDAIYVNFPGAGCNDAEAENPDSNDCISEAESIALVGTDDLAGTIDRSGQQLPRTPDYKIVLDMDYWYPVLDQYKATFNSRLAFSDGYIVNVTDYEEINKFGAHENWDINVGFGDIDNVWRVSFWARNLTNARIEYFPEFDVDPDGHQNTELPQNYFRTYGIQLQYNFR